MYLSPTNTLHCTDYHPCLVPRAFYTIPILHILQLTIAVELCELSFSVCVCVSQVHRGRGRDVGEEMVEITGEESARQSAQELIQEVISTQDFRGV